MTPAAAGTVPHVLLAFTPAHAAFGGLLLGVAVVANLLLNGRVLGISGVAKGLVTGHNKELWRWSFILGLMAAAPVMANLFPTSFEAMPPSMSVARSVASGLLVGLGTAFGNGCTSGHGICGISRLSVRSMAYTITFMIAGALAATLSDAVAALSIAPVAPKFEALTAAEQWLGVNLLAGSVGALLAVAALYKAVVKSQRAPSAPPSARTSASNLQLQPDSPTRPTTSSSSLNDAMQVLSSLVIGAVFSAGLSMSGMTRPSKVVGFLSVRSPSWDASLMFVMAAAIGVSIGAYQAVMGHWFKLPAALAQPLMSKAYSLPTASHLDAQLVGGAVLFGTGWGLSGMCPGPAMVVAASPVASKQVWLYLASMLLAFRMQPSLARMLLSTKTRATA